MMMSLQPIKHALVVVLCCGLVAQPVEAGRPKDSPNLISISVKQTEVAELYEMLSRQNHVNILLASKVEGEVTVNLYNISVKDAIYAIASAAGLAVERINNGYLISKRTDVGKTIAGGMKEVRTYKIHYSDTKQVADILQKHLSQYGKLDFLDDRNMLVIEDLPDFLARMESLIEQLDQPPAQILIEAKIFNITLDDELSFGVDWTKTFSAGGGKGNVGVENLGRQALDLAIGSAAGPAGLFFNYFNDTIEAQLNLLSKKGKVRALATPSLLALEHQEAEVVIGDRRGYKLTTVNVGVSTETIQFLESGVILRVKPHIDRMGRIMMEIHPEISSGTVNDDTGVPDQTTTEVTTRLLVEDGATVFIGGLIRNEMASEHQGVPLLEDIPLLGYLFSTEDETRSRSETIVLIRPQIIRAHNAELLNGSNGKINQFDRFGEQNAEQINDYFKNKEFYSK